MKEKTRILFICIHNSGRSQMAETFLKTMGGEQFEAESAGLEPRPVNPYVIRVMKEIGYDLSGNTSDSVMQFFKEGRL
jgi:arsenate reductase